MKNTEEFSSKVEIKLENAAPAVYSFPISYGFEEILCEKRSAARFEAAVTAAAFVIAVLSAFAAYFLITIISGLAVVSGIISLSGIKRSAQKTLSAVGEKKRLYEFYTYGFLIHEENGAAYFPYEKLEGFRDTKGHFIIRTENGTEYVIPKSEKTDKNFTRFLNEKIKRSRK